MSLHDRMNRFVSALESSGLGAENVQSAVTGRSARVVCSLPGPSVNRAQSLASAYGFNLVGKESVNQYKFEAYERLGEGGGLSLPGGVR